MSEIQKEIFDIKKTVEGLKDSTEFLKSEIKLMKEDFSNNFNIKDRKEKMQFYAKKALELTQNFLEDKIPQIDNLIKRIDYLGTGNEGMQIKMDLKESILSLSEFIQKFKNIVKQNGDTDYYKNVIDKINSTLYKLSKNNISVTAVSGVRG